jgi:hypothetical protein
LDVEAESQ